MALGEEGKGGVCLTGLTTGSKFDPGGIKKGGLLFGPGVKGRWAWCILWIGFGFGINIKGPVWFCSITRTISVICQKFRD